MTLYDIYRLILINALESYREEPKTSEKHKFIDYVLKMSLTTAKYPTDKKYHNLIMLKYIYEDERSKSAIAKALHIGRQSYDSIVEKAIDRLMVLAFGIDGLKMY